MTNQYLSPRHIYPFGWIIIVLIAFKTASANPILPFISNSPAIYWALCIEDARYEDFEALAASSQDTLYAGTFGDGVFRSDDHGTTWITATTGITLPLYVNNALAVSPVTPTTVFVGDYYGGGVYRSLDRGGHWAQVLPGISARALLVHPITPTLVLAGDREAGLWRSSDGGEQWGQVTAPLSSTHIMALASDAHSGLIYMGAGQFVERSADTGLTWETVGVFSSTVQALAVHPITPTLLYAGAFSHGLYRSLDGGATWHNSSQGLPANAWITSLSIAAVPPGIIYAGAWNGQVYRSLDQGATWEGLGYLGNVYAVQAHPTAPGILYVGTGNNGLFRGGVLDHIAIEPITGTHYVGQSFPVTVTARDALGFVLSGSTLQEQQMALQDAKLATTLSDGYQGRVTLRDHAGLLAPPMTFDIVNGVGTQSICFLSPVKDDFLIAALDGLQTQSALFDIQAMVYIYLPAIFGRDSP